MNDTPTVQTSKPTASAPADRFTRDGLTIFRRPGYTKFTCRIRFQGKVHWLTLAETAKASFEIAFRARRALHEGRWDALKPAVSLRQDVGTTLGQVFTTYDQFTGLDRPSDTTRRQNTFALQAILHEVLGPTADLEHLPLTQLTADLVYQWKELKRKLADAADDDERAVQILRSANSRLRQARSLFAASDDLRKFYLHHKLALPANLDSFCKEPPFSDCAKEEYHAPSDSVISATFSSLDKLLIPQDGLPVLDTDRNMYLAVWLALGFGLRKSEISQARASWFTRVGDTIICQGDVLAKNRKFPHVRVQLGAWAKLGPIIESLQPADYVLSGSLTERSDLVFRRISEWMRTLGWQTTHHTHEFRAYAGCQIAMAPGGRGLLDAQVFMRHASFATTERYYGHHLKIRLKEVQLSLPTISPAFTPVILPTPAQAS